MSIFLTLQPYLSDKKIPVWIRHVLVPTITDFDEDLYRLRILFKL